MQCWVRTPPRRPLPPLQREPPPPPPSPGEVPLLPPPRPQQRRRPQLPRRGRLRQRQLRRYPRELQVGALVIWGQGRGGNLKRLSSGRGWHHRPCYQSYTPPSPLYLCEYPEP